jgi:WD40 repeat protein
MGFSTYDARSIIVALVDLDDTYTANVQYPFVSFNAMAGAVLTFIVSNTDSIDHVVTVWNTDSNPTEAILGSLTIAAGAGTGTVPSVNLLTCIPVPSGQPLLLIPDNSIKVSMPVKPSADKHVYFNMVVAMM